MKCYRYKAYGLSICSEVECPELMQAPDSEGDSEAVQIRHGDVPPTLEDPKEVGVL